MWIGVAQLAQRKNRIIKHGRMPAHKQNSQLQAEAKLGIDNLSASKMIFSAGVSAVAHNLQNHLELQANPWR